MKQGALINAAKKVYGEHTQWSGAQLQRLELLAREIESAGTEERNFCPRCGKRLGTADHIHTCTPPETKK